MIKVLIKVIVVKMEKGGWIDYSYLVELDGDKEGERWKNECKILGLVV